MLMFLQLKNILVTHWFEFHYIPYLCLNYYYNQSKMNALFMILGVIGPWQIILIIAVVLLLFGGKKIPELMKGLGSGIKEFKDATKEENTSDSSKDQTNTNQ